MICSSLLLNLRIASASLRATLDLWLFSRPQIPAFWDLPNFLLLVRKLISHQSGSPRIQKVASDLLGHLREPKTVQCQKETERALLRLTSERALLRLTSERALLRLTSERALLRLTSERALLRLTSVNATRKAILPPVGGHDFLDHLRESKIVHCQKRIQ